MSELQQSHDSHCSTESDGENEQSNEISLKLAKKRFKKNSRKEKLRQKRRDKNQITEDDYYSKLKEFQTWLKEEKSLQIEEIEPKEKIYFKKFVKKWNSQHLSKKYYRGIDHTFGNAKTPSSKHSMDIQNATGEKPFDFLRNGNHLSPVDSNNTRSAGALKTVRRKKTFSTFGKMSSSDQEDEEMNADCSDTISIMSTSTAFTYDTISLTSFTSNVIGSRFSQASLPSSCDTWSSFSSASSISTQNQNDYCRITRSRSSQSSLSSKTSNMSNTNPVNPQSNEICLYEEVGNPSAMLINEIPNENIGNVGQERLKNRSLRSFRKSKQKIVERMSSFMNEAKHQSEIKPTNNITNVNGINEEYIQQQHLLNHQRDCDRKKAMGEMTRSPGSSDPRLILQRYMDDCDEETFV